MGVAIVSIITPLVGARIKFCSHLNTIGFAYAFNFLGILFCLNICFQGLLYL